MTFKKVREQLGVESQNRIVNNIALHLTKKYGKEWSWKQLRHCLCTAKTFTIEEILAAVQRQLSWNNLKAIAYDNDKLNRQLYLEMAIVQRWSTIMLNEQIDKLLYTRTAIATKPEKQAEEAINGCSNEV